jgi:hypothetical protein
MKRNSRPPAALPASFNRQLTMYALAAGAAGVGLLTLTPPAEAKIVYTPAHQKLPINQDFFLDVDHNGTNDFRLHIATLNPRFPSQTNCVYASLNVFPQNRGNGLVGQLHSGLSSASALRLGTPIGPRRRFNGSRNLMAEIMSCPVYGYFGLWENNGHGVRNRYLGLKFTIKGKIHYGWARMNVRATVQSNGKYTVNALLTGYAYETIPNKRIIAGQTKGTDDSNVEQPDAALTMPTPEPASLGALAMGAPGLSIWRREESVLVGD